MGVGRVGIATGRVAHRVVGRVRVGDGAQPRDGVDLVGVGVAVGPCRAAAQAIQRVGAVRLGVGSERGPTGRSHAMIASAGRATVARPHQPIERIITERLILSGGA